MTRVTTPPIGRLARGIAVLAGVVAVAVALPTSHAHAAAPPAPVAPTTEAGADVGVAPPPLPVLPTAPAGLPPAGTQPSGTQPSSAAPAIVAAAGPTLPAVATTPASAASLPETGGRSWTISAVAALLTLFGALIRRTARRATPSGAR